MTEEQKTPGRPKKRAIIVQIKMAEDLAKLLKVLAARNRRSMTAEIEIMTEARLREEGLLETPTTPDL